MRGLRIIAGILTKQLRPLLQCRHVGGVLGIPFADYSVLQTWRLRALARKWSDARPSISEGEAKMIVLYQEMQYPHWLIVAGSILVLLGSIGALGRRRNVEPGPDPNETNAE
jgi:hypothetical protein